MFDLQALLEIRDEAAAAVPSPRGADKARAAQSIADGIVATSRRISSARASAQAAGRQMSAFETRRMGRLMGEALVDLAGLVRLLGLDAAVVAQPYMLQPDEAPGGSPPLAPKIPTIETTAPPADQPSSTAAHRPIQTIVPNSNSSPAHHHFRHHRHIQQDEKLHASKQRSVAAPATGHQHHQRNVSSDDHANGELFPYFEQQDDDSSNCYYSGPEHSFGRRRFVPDARQAAQLLHDPNSAAANGQTHGLGNDGSPLFFKAAISVSSHDAIAAHGHGQNHGQQHGAASSGTEDQNASSQRPSPPVLTMPTFGAQQQAPAPRVVYVLDKPKVTEFVQRVLSLDHHQFSSEEFETFGIRWCIPGVSVVEHKATPMGTSLQLEGSGRGAQHLQRSASQQPLMLTPIGSPRGMPSRMSSLDIMDEADGAAGSGGAGTGNNNTNGQLSRRSSIGRPHTSPDFFPLAQDGNTKIVHKSEFPDFVHAMVECLKDVTNETGVHFW